MAIGLFFALFPLYPPVASPLQLVLYAALLGTLAGALTGIFSYALSKRSHMSNPVCLEAASYEVTIEEDFAENAERLLGSLSSSQDQQTPAE